jgi:DNA-binding FadR family transcriptional regulator
MIPAKVESDFLRYLLTHGCTPGKRLPSLQQISEELGISVGKLREQLEVARELGLVEASPRRGITCMPYRFAPAVRLSLMCALAIDDGAFAAFGVLRSHLEVAFWDEATALLTAEDKAQLQLLVQQAWTKLNRDRVQIPHAEHRKFHLAIYKRLDNPFVSGILEAYWDAYEAVELNTYADYNYLTAVWQYHERIADAIANNDFETGKTLLVDHMNLLSKRGSSLQTLDVPGKDVEPVAPVTELPHQ